MNDTCQMPAWFDTVATTMREITYDILPFPFFLIAFPGHIILLIGFLRQAKKEKAYVYQVFFTVSKICEIVGVSLSMLWLYLGGYKGVGVDWVKRSYGTMFVAGHLVPALTSVSVTNSVLITLAMSIDRTMAIINPLKYKLLNQKFLSRLAAVCCLIISIFFSVWIGFARDVVLSTDSGNSTIYALRYSASGGVYNLPWVQAITKARNNVRSAAAVLLIMFNVIMSVYLRQNTMKVAKMVTTNDMATRTSADNARLALAICQSAVTLALCIPEGAYTLALEVIGDQAECWDDILGPYLDGSRQVVDMLDIFLILAINRQMRRTFAKVVPIHKLVKMLFGKSIGTDQTTTTIEGNQQKGSVNGPKPAWK